MQISEINIRKQLIDPWIAKAIWQLNNKQQVEHLFQTLPHWAFRRLEISVVRCGIER